MDVAFTLDSDVYSLLIATEHAIELYIESSDEYRFLRNLSLTTGGSFASVAFGQDYLALGKKNGLIDFHSVTNPATSLTAGVDATQDSAEEILSLDCGGNVFASIYTKRGGQGAPFEVAAYLQPYDVDNFGKMNDTIGLSGAAGIKLNRAGNVIFVGGTNNVPTLLVPLEATLAPAPPPSQPPPFALATPPAAPPLSPTASDSASSVHGYALAIALSFAVIVA